MKKLKIKLILLLIVWVSQPNEIYGQFLSAEDSVTSNLEIIEKLIPEIIHYNYLKNNEFSSNTSDTIVLNKRDKRNLDSNIIYIGKFLDSTIITCVTYSAIDSSLLFYNLTNNKWKTKGEFKSEYGFWIDHLDLDGDSINEILICNGPNINGNIWYEIYKFNFATDSFYNSGNICCIDSIIYKNKVIYEYHTGSIWMNSYQTKYKWVNGYLIPIQKVELIPNLKYINSVPRWVLFDYWITYWENTNLTSTKMKRKFKFVYLPKYHSKYWENFKHL